MQVDLVNALLNGFPHVPLSCVICNWVNDVFWPWGPLGAFGAAGAGFFGGGGLFGGGGSGQNDGGQDDSGADETAREPDYHHRTQEEDREWRRFRPGESEEEYRERMDQDRDAHRDSDIRRMREKFYKDPSYVGGVRWFQEWFDFEADEFPTVPGGGKA